MTENASAGGVVPAEFGQLKVSPWVSTAVRLGGVAVQLLFLLLIIGEFRLATSGAANLLKLAATGMVINALLPLRLRLPFFALLSVAGIFLVLGMDAGAALVLIGLALIGLCHIPVSFKLRVAFLLAAGAALAIMRGGWLGTIDIPWLVAIGPVLGSMFMFRLIIYVYDRRHDPEPATLSSSIAYFFMLPNVAFPFFPVIDYRTMRRTYYEGDPFTIYQRGVDWILRGVVHLILYRLIYYYVALSPGDVANAGQLLQFIVTNYLLYLRVSGVFHLIVGVMHLFGFHLPETHHLYYLASSFTDYWRRINIYWKDFMMKVFYYPSFFRLRKLGPTTGLVLSTAVVFVVTTLLHSYQWFWLLGDAPLTIQDMVFWSMLGVLVIGATLREAKKGRKRTLGRRRVTGPERLGLVLKTTGMFLTMSVLWSFWTSGSVAEWFAMWSALGNGVAINAELGFTVLALGLAVGSVVSAGAPPGPTNGVLGRVLRVTRSPAATGLTILALFLVGRPSVYGRFNATTAYLIESLQHQRLNRQDQAALERGYYENLLAADATNPELWSRYSKRPLDWRNLFETDIARPTTDWRGLEMVPSSEILYKGAMLTTNQWGMRDREYEQARSANTFRAAILGPSTVMGSGVENDQTFEWVLEDRLNAERTAGEPAYELLNFGIEAHTLAALVLDADRAMAFRPDAVWYVAHETEFDKSIAALAQILTADVPIDDPELAALAMRAGVEPGMKEPFALRRLQVIERELILWGYRRIVAAAREGGAQPAWIFMPMPVGGRGAPCAPGRAELFCFGNIAKPGTAADRNDPRVEALFELAEEAGFDIVDLSGVYDGHELQSLWISAWDGHPNALGHRLVADRLWFAWNADPPFGRAP
ncbi:MAG TPA: SGNH/GDSL hydrolase family protein [Gemmatimonadales bacterium]